MGGGDDINLGLNVNLGLDKSIQDASTLANQIRDMRQDQEAFVNSVADSQEKLSLITDELSKQLEFKQEMITAEQQLKEIQESQKNNAQDMLSSYRELNNVVSNLALNLGRIGGGGTIDMSRMGGAGGTPMGQGGSGEPVEQQRLYGPSGQPMEPVRQRRKRTGGGGGGEEESPDFSQTPYSTEEEQGRMSTGSPGGQRQQRQTADAEQQPRILGPSGQPIESPNNFVENEKDTLTAPDVVKQLMSFIPSYGRGASLKRYLDYTSNLSAGGGGGGLQGSLSRQLSGAFPADGSSPNMAGRMLGRIGINSAEELSGALGSVGRFGVGASMYGQAALYAYDKVAQGLQEGQLYSGLTGGTSVMGALGQDLGAQITAGFGFNPMESYGTAKQIRMDALSMGYGQNTSLFNNAVGFGNYAASNFQMDPSQSMAMFNQAVVQAGSSASALHAALQSVAQQASTSALSFAQAQQTLSQSSAMAGAMGITGVNNTILSTAASTFAKGDLALQQSGYNPLSILSSLGGQALVAQQMGTNVMNLPYAMSQTSAAGQANAINMGNERMLNLAGIDSTNWRDQNLLLQRMSFAKSVFQSLGADMSAFSSTQAYLEMVQKTFNGSLVSGVNNETNTQIQNAFGNNDTLSSTDRGSAAMYAGAVSRATQGMTGTAKAMVSAAVTNSSGNSKVFQRMEDIRNKKKWQHMGVQIGSNFVTLEALKKKPEQEAEQIGMLIETGYYKIGPNSQYIKDHPYSSTFLDLEGDSQLQDSAYGGQGGSTNTTAQAYAESAYAQMLHAQGSNKLNASQAANINSNLGLNSTQSSQLQKLELGPQAAKFFQLVENPAAFEKWLNDWKRSGGKPTL